MTITEILRILDHADAKFVLLLGHQNTDPDALCSAYAFQKLLKKLRPGIVTEIGRGQGVSKLSNHILNNLSIAMNPKPNVENAEAIVLLDTNTIQQLGDLASKVAESNSPIIIIDHHAPHPETIKRATFYMTKEEASSACEVVYDLFRQAKVKIGIDEAKALFLGIAFDTRHFVLANASTFKSIVELTEAGVNPPETLSLLTMPMSQSERVARIKACQRAKILKIEGWIVALSTVSAYQASAARALLDLGAQAAAVAGKKNDNVEISLRCTREFQKGTGIHLERI